MTDPDTARPPGPETPAEFMHELGNRLAAIVAFSHLIRTDPRLPDDLHDQADLLVEEADRTRHLVEGLLDAVAGRAYEPRSAAAPSARSSAAPATEPARVAAAATEPADPKTASARILVVDDEPAIRDFLARILGRIGYEVVLAADGREALEIVRSDPPDAILSDHRMAGMTGPAFHAAVSEVSPELGRRFAFMTGDVTNPELSAVANARGIVLLAKPFDIGSVEQTVEGILDT